MTQESSASNSSPNSTPRKSKNRNKKNPYSDRGLDKFSALLTDLQEKKQKIYSQTDPENIALLRFAYKNSHECVPVLVKHKEKKEDKSAIVNLKEKHGCSKSASEKANKESKNVEKKNKWSKPSYYLTAILILILLLMSGFGRSVTILCTSLFWYLVPVLKGSSKSTKKAKNLTEKKIIRDGLSTPFYNSSDGMKDKSRLVRRGDRKSW